MATLLPVQENKFNILHPNTVISKGVSGTITHANRMQISALKAFIEQEQQGLKSCLHYHNIDGKMTFILTHIDDDENTLTMNKGDGKKTFLRNNADKIEYSEDFVTWFEARPYQQRAYMVAQQNKGCFFALIEDTHSTLACKIERCAAVQRVFKLDSNDTVTYLKIRETFVSSEDAILLIPCDSKYKRIRKGATYQVDNNGDLIL